jgi:hypothetical protein
MLAALVASPALAAERDVFDRDVAPLLEGRPRLVLLANRHTARDVRTQASELALRLHALAYVTVVRVDLRGVPGLFESFAHATMRDAHAESTRESRARRLALGLPVPPDLDDRLVFVPDSDGERHQALGLGRGFDEALVVVEDALGRELLRAPFPRDFARVESSLRALAAPAAPGPAAQ